MWRRANDKVDLFRSDQSSMYNVLLLTFDVPFITTRMEGEGRANDVTLLLMFSSRDPHSGRCFPP